MPTSLILGSGPAAAGAALALAQDPQQRITVLDIGGTLDAPRDAVREAMAEEPEARWSSSDLRLISRHAVPTGPGELPEKRAYGSDFPFRDFGQLSGVQAGPHTNRSVVSGAYGGFSNVWGAQIMPFSRATFADWPVSYEEMLPHYRVALDEMALAGEEDDLAPTFPLLTTARPLPPLGHRAEQVLTRYDAHRGRLQAMGVTVGRARLALRSEGCTRCGLCMTGCPYRLIYSASHTFDRLRSSGRIDYHGGVMAVRLSEQRTVPTVEVRELGSGDARHWSADRIFVACGGVGTTRLVLGSLDHFDRPVQLAESAQFILPAISLRSTPDPRNERNFTLNQFNLVFDAGGGGYDLSQIHFYPYNPVFEDSLPALLRHELGGPALTRLLRRLSVGLGYLPSWASPPLEVVARRPGATGLPDLALSSPPVAGWPPMLRVMARALVRAASTLDLWPVLPETVLSPAAKSYHFGGSFPFGRRHAELGTDRLGRLGQWRNIHMVDASVFPTVPATTFTLTIMANAHRIAAESIAGSDRTAGA
ncbi:MAG: GMC oxidoreductase [Acidimicrobiales bacterium]